MIDYISKIGGFDISVILNLIVTLSTCNVTIYVYIFSYLFHSPGQPEGIPQFLFPYTTCIDNAKLPLWLCFTCSFKM